MPTFGPARLSRQLELTTPIVRIKTFVINTCYNTQNPSICPSYCSAKSRVVSITNHGADGKFDVMNQIPEGTGPVVIDIRQVMNQARLPR